MPRLTPEYPDVTSHRSIHGTSASAQEFSTEVWVQQPVFENSRRKRQRKIDDLKDLCAKLEERLQRLKSEECSALSRIHCTGEIFILSVSKQDTIIAMARSRS